MTAKNAVRKNTDLTNLSFMRETITVLHGDVPGRLFRMCNGVVASLWVKKLG